MDWNERIAAVRKAAGLTQEQLGEPTDEAVEICGFGEPAAVLTVQYTDETGAQQMLTLTVGGVMPGDGSDTESRYIRLDDDTTIYEMSGSSLEALLTLAQNGLE